MLGMPRKSKHYFRVGENVYEYVEVDGPIRRGDEELVADFDHVGCKFYLSRSVPVGRRPVVAAAAISDLCFRLWKPLPVIQPTWQPDEADPHEPGPDPADGR